MFVRASTGWVPAGSSVNGTSQRYRYIATSGQTTFTGADSNGNTLTYDAGFVDIYLNGVRLDSTDFTASSGTSIVLASGAALNDELNIVAFGTFNVAAFNGSGLIDGTTNISKLNATGTRSSSTFLAGDNTFKTVAVTPTAVSDQLNSSTGYFDLPAGTTAERPGSPPSGATRYNTSTGSIEFYNGSTWVSTNLIPVVNSVTGTIWAGAVSNLTLSVSNITDTITVRFSESGSTVADVSNVVVTGGSATVAVPAAVYGQTAGDTIAVSVINADGTPSSNAVNKTVSPLATGGTIVVSGGYRYHTFTSSSSLVAPTGFSAVAEFLIIGGGGGGGSDGGGGGGAGGYLKVTGQTLTANTYSVTVGAGGAGGNYTNSAATNGGNSVFNSVNTAIGGGSGGGGAPTTGSGFTGVSGGSGGGGSRANSGGAGTSGQGFAGGNSTSSVYEGGGGGAGAVGGNGASAGSAPGGVGKNTDSTWASATSTGSGGYYAGGGGGGYDGAINGVNAGGSGGGGNGGDNSNAPVAGSTNTGGGGGGNTSTGPTYSGANRGGAPGGSGIVIVRYAL